MNTINLTDNQKKEIQNIMDSMECPKDFKCFHSNFVDVCAAKTSNLTSFVECGEKRDIICRFSISYGYSQFCDCPLRVYIKKNLSI